MQNISQQTIYRSALSIAIALALGACGNSSNKNRNTDPAELTFDASLFDATSATVDNAYFPLTPGKTLIYEGEDETVEYSVSHDTRMVAGIEAAIVVDRAYDAGELVEETFDWYAQDIHGNVWYLGEESKEYENGVAISSDGSWETGKDIDGVGQNAVAGIKMKAAPFTVGDTYLQEYYPTVAEDMGEIIALDVPLSLDAVELEDESQQSSFTTLQTREWVPLDADPSSTEEYKYFAPGIGLVLETDISSGEEVQLVEVSDDSQPKIDVGDFSNPTLIDNPLFPLTIGDSYAYSTVTGADEEFILIEVLPDAKQVMGIDVVVVRDRVYIDGDNTTGLLIEDTHDWYAQDDEGNVWYLGEEVDNYDEDSGVFLNNDGAWEAGVDGALPGIVMKANPRVGDSYRQEFLAGEAEDLATIVASDLDVTLNNGDSYSGVFKFKEWTPLEEDSVEYKYFAPNVGFVREEKLDDVGAVEEAIERE
jgi:roadblock/LC7 domain-containing protein